jgi:SAM-dependent methyltransferase
MRDSEVKKIVRERYGNIARSGNSCCGAGSSCCGSPATNISQRVGYSREEIAYVPEGANLGLGCGNPVAIASLRPGETVIDLGSGPGLDCFLAASKVGSSGHVIGVDMTPEMVERARLNAEKGDYSNVEFRLGEIENLPIADASADVVISNCVINLSPHKPRVFAEAYRVLKLGGRLMVSDIVLLREIPECVRNSIDAYVGCVAGAELKDRYLAAIKAAGFTAVSVVGETAFPLELLAGEAAVRDALAKVSLSPDILSELAGSVVSVQVSAHKPSV